MPEQALEMMPAPRIHHALLSDLATLERLIRRSVMELMAVDYSLEQRASSIGPLFGVDRQVIEDNTYYTVKAGDVLLGCGGWSFRRTLFGGDDVQNRDNTMSDPRTEAAHIRAFYVDPDHARKGVATLLLRKSEIEAAAHGFRKLELGATLTGERFYLRHGFRSGRRLSVELPGRIEFPLVHMEKAIGD